MKQIHCIAFILVAGALPGCVLEQDEQEQIDVVSEEVGSGSEALYGCGLEKQDMGSYYAYTVRNCHYYPVWRSVVFTTGTPGKCRRYGAAGSGDDIFAGTAQRRPHHLIAC